MALLDQIRAARETESKALIAQAGLPDPLGLSSGINMEGTMAAAAFGDEIASMIHDATDDDLLAAYERTDGQRSNPEADALIAEIERRNLDI